VLLGEARAQLEVAARVAWAGAGINLRTETPTSGQIGEAVRTLLVEGSYRARAEALAARFAEHDAAAEAAALVEALPGVGTLARGATAA
jgi:UDP:flavonoid glycosyltransferase YjiC (YdhE family)